MRTMKKFLFMTAVALCAVSAFAVKPSTRAAIFTNPQNYEATVIAVGTMGTKYFRVSGYGKKVDGAVFQAQMNAVHACIFKGVLAPRRRRLCLHSMMHRSPSPKTRLSLTSFLRLTACISVS